MATFEGLITRCNGLERPFVLSRSFFAGSQRMGKPKFVGLLLLHNGSEGCAATNPVLNNISVWYYVEDVDWGSHGLKVRKLHL